MTDRELLEMAAKAAGIDLPIGTPNYFDGTEDVAMWNPSDDDGDALRLAVKLDLVVGSRRCWRPYAQRETYVWIGTEEEEGELDNAAATRRAIVRVAAEIGKVLK